MAIFDDLDLLIRSRYPLIYLVTWEEERVINTLEQIAAKRNKALFTWSSAEGLNKVSDRQATPDEATKDPLTLLDNISKNENPAIYLLEDFHPFLCEHGVVRKLRETARALRNSYKTIVLSSPVMKIPQELEKLITVIDFPFPTSEEIKQILNELITTVKRNPQVRISSNPEIHERLVKAALGLTATEAERAFAKVLVRDNSLDESDIPFIIEEKEQVIKKTGILEYYHAQEKLSNVGGLDGLKEWLQKRSGAFSDKAREFGLPEPKGILLMGVQGCGKSLTAKAIASQWNLPMLRLDVGNVFSGVVGSSEENMRKAIRTAESIAPSVLWIDEIEKGFSGIASSNVSDAGTTARIFGTFITWLQEKKEPVFVIATANDISALPPELLRKGRFDEIFFIDLPSHEERKDIFKIHLKQRKRIPESFYIEQLAQTTGGWSGAEIEQAVIASLYDAFEGNREITQDDLQKNIAAMVPLSTTMKETIDSIRSWAKTRARPASKNDIFNQTTKQMAAALEIMQ